MILLGEPPFLQARKEMPRAAADRTAVGTTVEPTKADPNPNSNTNPNPNPNAPGDESRTRGNEAYGKRNFREVAAEWFELPAFRYQLK